MSEKNVVECNRCRSRTTDTVPAHYCRACARFLEGQDEATRKLDSTNKVTDQLLHTMAFGMVSMGNPEYTHELIKKLGESAYWYAFDGTANNMTQEELTYLNQLIQFLGQQVYFYEGILSEREKIKAENDPRIDVFN